MQLISVSLMLDTEMSVSLMTRLLWRYLSGSCRFSSCLLTQTSSLKFRVRAIIIFLFHLIICIIFYQISIVIVYVQWII